MPVGSFEASGEARNSASEEADSEAEAGGREGMWGMRMTRREARAEAAAGSDGPAVRRADTTAKW